MIFRQYSASKINRAGQEELKSLVGQRRVAKPVAPLGNLAPLHVHGLRYGKITSGTQQRLYRRRSGHSRRHPARASRIEAWLKPFKQGKREAFRAGATRSALLIWC